MSSTALFALLLSAMVGVSQSTLQARDPIYVITIRNKCSHAVDTTFQPRLPNGVEVGVMDAGTSHDISVKTNSWKGYFTDGTSSGTRGEIDFGRGLYDISRAAGFSVPLYLQNQGKQEQGQCTGAYCATANCQDAYTEDSGLLDGARKGDPSVIPNHQCPPDFPTWQIQWC